MKLFVGAKGLITNQNCEVLIVREADTYDEGTELGKWDVVGGRIDVGEKILDGLVREINEESGLRVVVGDCIGVTETFPTIKGEQCHIIRVYYACKTEQSDVVLSNDHDKFEWIQPHTYTTFPIMEDLHNIFDSYIAAL